MKEEVRAFKLITGEEVIAHTTQSQDEHTPDSKYTLRQPQIVVIGAHPKTGQLMNQLVPYLASNPEDGSITIKETAILGEVSNVPEQLYKAYLQHTSKIQIA